MRILIAYYYFYSAVSIPVQVHSGFVKGAETRMIIQKLAVIGGGIMGRQIALNAAICGYETKVTDAMAAVREDVGSWAETYLSGRIAKGRMSEEQVAKIKKRFTVADTTQEAVCDADLVIEAVVEREDVKKEVFREISRYAPAKAILATNSSRMPSSTFIGCVKDPGKLANMHYNNPALVMKAVEVQQNEQTTGDTVQTLLEFVRKNGKTPIHIRREVEGLAVSRILHSINEEALFLVENGYCSIEDVDNACTAGLNHPMGPFRLMDLTGLDLNLDIRENEYKRTGVKPVGYDLFRSYVEKGRLGKKTGHGFYDYE